MSIVTGSLWHRGTDEQRSGSGVDILANAQRSQTSMALRELGKGAGLVARVESQPALQTFARAMTAKVNQVTGAPMELYEKRKVRTKASLRPPAVGNPIFSPSRAPTARAAAFSASLAVVVEGRASMRSSSASSPSSASASARSPRSSSLSRSSPDR